ncbi:MAG: hypothetical protein LBC30_01270 [Puniceicoccales bacterium]|jgi:tetratricopeptide (TPR) repeat protein|nr:hypothetical protein [Puniceicoccales bacterium]
MRNVESLTDYLLRNKHVEGKTHLKDYLDEGIFAEDRIGRLSAAETANQAETLVSYRINHFANVANAAICYFPIELKDEQYVMPELDIKEMTSIGVAMAMLIMSAMQNEIMLDTQIEAVEGAQNQKLADSNAAILKIKQQIRKSRYKTPFQKFMEALSNSWIMKFLNSNYGKAIMFLIGAAVTIASFGSAGPAVIAISCTLMAFQAAELILGKSMGELLTSGMDDGAAKMALQMSIDIGLMVASVATGGGGAAKIDKAADAASAATDAVQMGAKVAQETKQVAEAADELSKVVNLADDVADAAQNVTKIANETAEAAENVVKAADTLSDALKNGESVADIAEKTQDLQKAMNALEEQTNQLKSAIQNLDDVMGSATDGLSDTAKQAMDKVKQLGDNVFDSAQKMQDAGQKTIDSAFDMTKQGASVVSSAARFVTGIKGLEHLNFAQQMVIALQKFQQRVQALMQVYQALYQLAMSEEEARNVTYAATVEAIRTKSDARQEFYQMLIDNQMADIQTLLSYTKASYERAAEAIREQGETNMMIVRNLVI